MYLQTHKIYLLRVLLITIFVFLLNHEQNTLQASHYITLHPKTLHGCQVP